MVLEEESCKFEAAILLLKDFVCGCVCIRSKDCGIEEACGAIQVLQEIYYHIYSTDVITQQDGASHYRLLKDGIDVKKEITNDGIQEIFLDPPESKYDIKYDYDNGHTYLIDNVDLSDDNTDKRNKKKTARKNKLKLKMRLLDEVVVKKETSEKIKTDTNIKVGKLLRNVKFKKKKFGLSKTAKTKMSLIKKRQEKNEHYNLFGKKYICAICNKRFAVKIFLERHIRKEHGPNMELVRWKCNQCGKFYASKVQLERHHMIHKGEKTFQCEICGRGFDTYDIRYIHQFVHMDNKYICDHCGKIYRQRRHLVQHMKNHNGHIWKCKDCGKIFDTQRKWLYHKKNHTNNIKKKQCDICGATFAPGSNMKNHMMIHLGYKPFQCNECDKSFVRAAGLRAHQKTHNNASLTHRCHLCGKMLTSRGLAYHLMVHEGNRPFKCDMCSKAFVTDFKLRKHKKIHLRLGHYKSEEEAGILKPRRKSSTCLPKDPPHSAFSNSPINSELYSSEIKRLPTELHIP